MAQRRPRSKVQTPLKEPGLARGKHTLYLRVPVLYVWAADAVAGWTSPRKPPSRAAMLRKIIEAGLQVYFVNLGRSWPPLPSELRRPVERVEDRRAFLEDRTAFVKATLDELFDKQPRWTALQLRRAFHHRDANLVHEELGDRIRAGKIRLVQEETNGRYRAAYVLKRPRAPAERTTSLFLPSLRDPAGAPKP